MKAQQAVAVPERLRIDKWLWFARFLKTRSLAAALVEAGEVTVNGVAVTRPSHGLRPGDTLAIVIGRRRRVIRVLALADRRGPAEEAQALYEELAPPEKLPLL